MKKFLILLILIVFAFSFESAFSQKKVKNFNYALTIDPIDIIMPGEALTVTYEAQISKDNSYTIFSHLAFLGSPWQVYNVGATYKWYLLAGDTPPLQGLSVGPALALGYAMYESDQPTRAESTYDDGFVAGIGFDVAYKIVVDKGLTIEPNAMVLLNLIDLDGLDGFSHYPGFQIGINVGYAWK